MGSGHCSDAEPYVFTVILSCMFPTPCVFGVVLARFGLAVAQRIGAWAADLFKTNEKMQASRNMCNKMPGNIKASASGSPQDFIFPHTLLAETSAHRTF